MTVPRRVPPGRAARLRLRHSLDVALRGADLLDRKLRILRKRHRLLLRQERDAEQAWHERLGEAETWLLRGLLLGGERALTTAAVAARADVAVEWAVSMGVHHPSGVSCTDAVRAAWEPLPAGTALVHAEAAYRDAVRTAAALAAARTAARLMAAEIERTGRRARALRRHWIPQLSTELTIVDQSLEQAGRPTPPGRSPTTSVAPAASSCGAVARTCDGGRGAMSGPGARWRARRRTAAPPGPAARRASRAHGRAGRPRPPRGGAPRASSSGWSSPDTSTAAPSTGRAGTVPPPGRVSPPVCPASRPRCSAAAPRSGAVRRR